MNEAATVSTENEWQLSGERVVVPAWLDGRVPGRLSIDGERIRLELLIHEDDDLTERIRERIGGSLPPVGEFVTAFDAAAADVEWKWRWTSRNTLHKFTLDGVQWKIQYHTDYAPGDIWGGDMSAAGRQMKGLKWGRAVRERLKSIRS